MEPVVSLQHVTHAFSGVVAVDDVELTASPGRLTALLGPSGCGKTTILRIIAGYLRPDSGRVLLNGRDAAGLPPERRNIGMVFQSYALFPHMTIAKNVAFGLRMRGLTKHTVRARVREALALVGLDELGDRRPRELSGGQQQRAALARAVAIRPSVLLLDEPLSNLDARHGVQMRKELRRIQRETGLATVLVTHNQEEALELADEIVIFDRGRVMQCGSPQEIFMAPATRWVAEFLGYENFVDLPGKGPVAVRPEHVGVLAPGEDAPGDAHLMHATVVDVRFRGTDYVITCESDGRTVVAVSADGDLRTGVPARVCVPLDRAVRVGRPDAPLRARKGAA